MNAHRILGVDHDRELGRAVARCLRVEGHDVVVAGDGAEALIALARDPAFDVVICDMRMPTVDGVDLHEAALAIDPSLARRFIFSPPARVRPARPRSSKTAWCWRSRSASRPSGAPFTP